MSQQGKLSTFVNSSGLQTLTGDSGGAVSGSGIGNINIIGTGGVTVTGNPGTNTLSINYPGVGGFIWNVIPATTENLVEGNGYLANNVTNVDFLLPVTSTVGDTFRISSIQGLWSISQGAGQLIHMGNQTSTTGITGAIISTSTRDSIELICVLDNTEFQVLSSIGNVTIV